MTRAVALPSRRTADVVVVGGGPAGTATAVALRRQGVDRVVLVEAGSYETARVGESVPPDTRAALQQLGVLASFLRQGHARSHGSCSAWGSHVLGHHDTIVSPHGHGWHLDRQRFDRWLAEEAAARGVDVHLRTRFRGVEAGSAGRAVRVQVESAGTNPWVIDCRFVVDASGRASAVARRLGARRRVDQALVCSTGWLEETGWTDSMTMLEAVEYGWWYLALLPDGRVAVAVTSDSAGIRRQRLTEPRRWSAALAATRHVGPAVARGRLSPSSLRTSAVPISLLDPPADPGWLAVGDAAACRDPLGGHGVHTALDGGIRAAATVRRWLDGDATALSDHRVDVGERFVAHLRQRDQLYGLEQRWPGAAFWRRQTRRWPPSTVTA